MQIPLIPESNHAAGGQGKPRAVRVGDAVRVRRQRWRVADVRPHAGCQTLTLAGVGPLNLGAERRVVMPFDVVEPLDRPIRLRVVRPRRWRRMCRSLLVDHGPVDRLKTAHRARIDLLPYQLEPTLAVLRGLGSRVLIADEVGLGKTIQAGLAVAELRARGAAEKVLILTPAGLREQWKEELASRFLLDAEIVDMRHAKRRAALAPLGVNPWSAIPIAIASFDYAKRPEVLPAVQSCRWDIVVVDEAHGVGHGSDRYLATNAICQLAPYVVLLTATPHSGDAQAFDSLCALGACANDALLMFRRSRRELALGSRRRIHRLQVRTSDAECLMHALLREFTRAVSADRGVRDRDVRLALATLHKRALSSPWSLERSIGRRLSALDSAVSGGGQQIALPFEDEGGELDGADVAPAWVSAGLDNRNRERQMLTALGHAAREATRHDTKLRALARLLGRLDAKRERAIVFTEYRDTLLHVRQQLSLPCALLHGGMARDERRKSLSDFTTGRQTILLATDAGGEGLNLHHECRLVINLELPWNPVRLEQRAGRVDRIGQRRTVHAFHLIAGSTGETRILERLNARVALARRDAAASDPLHSASIDDEEAAMSVVTGIGEWGSDSETSRPSTTRTSVSIDAAAEHERLCRVRAIVNRHEVTAAGAPVTQPALAFARHRTTRARLGKAPLVLTQATLEDSYGHVLASRLIAFMAHLDERARNLDVKSLADLCREIQQMSGAMSDLEGSGFEEESTRVHRAFWETRLQRELATAAAFSSHGKGMRQPGLFDRRADRSHLAWLEWQRVWAGDVERRLDLARRAMIVTAKASRLALILVP